MFTLLLAIGAIAADVDGWPMPGANPERTSWVAEEVPGRLTPIWYRPIEPYIGQNVHLVATGGLIYDPTGRPRDEGDPVRDDAALLGSDLHAGVSPGMY